MGLFRRVARNMFRWIPGVTQWERWKAWGEELKAWELKAQKNYDFIVRRFAEDKVRGFTILTNSIYGSGRTDALMDLYGELALEWAEQDPAAAREAVEKGKTLVRCDEEALYMFQYHQTGYISSDGKLPQGIYDRIAKEHPLYVLAETTLARIELMEAGRLQVGGAKVSPKDIKP